MQGPGKINGAAFSDIRLRTMSTTTLVFYPGGRLELAGVTVAFRRNFVLIAGSSSIFGVTRIVLMHINTVFSAEDLEIESIFKRLSKAEKPVITMALVGFSDAEIARHLDRSIHTIRSHKRSLSKKEFERARALLLRS